MKISQEDVILIKNLYLSKQYGAWRLLSELPDKSWNLGIERDTGMQKWKWKPVPSRSTGYIPVPFPQDPVKT